MLSNLTSLPVGALATIVAHLPRHTKLLVSSLHPRLRDAVISQPHSPLRVVDTQPGATLDETPPPGSKLLWDTLPRTVRDAGSALRILRLHAKLPLDVIQQTLSAAFESPRGLERLAMPAYLVAIPMLTNALPRLVAMNHLELSHPPVEALKLLHNMELMSNLRTLTFAPLPPSVLTIVNDAVWRPPRFSSGLSTPQPKLQLNLHFADVFEIDGVTIRDFIKRVFLSGAPLHPQIRSLALIPASQPMISQQTWYGQNRWTEPGTPSGAPPGHLFDNLVFDLQSAREGGKNPFPPYLAVSVGKWVGGALVYTEFPPMPRNDVPESAGQQIFVRQWRSLHDVMMALINPRDVTAERLQDATTLVLGAQDCGSLYRLATHRRRLHDMLKSKCNAVDTVVCTASRGSVSLQEVTERVLGARNVMRAIPAVTKLYLPLVPFVEITDARSAPPAEESQDESTALVGLLQACGSTLQTLCVTTVAGPSGGRDLLQSIPGLLRCVTRQCCNLECICVELGCSGPDVRPASREIVQRCCAALDQFEVAMPSVETAWLRAIVDAAAEDVKLDEA